MAKKTYKEIANELKIRDHLAADRTALANERTYLAYIRTAFALVAGGIGLMKLFEGNLLAYIFGGILTGLGIIVLGFGSYRFIYFRREMKETIDENNNDKKKEKK